MSLKECLRGDNQCPNFDGGCSLQTQEQSLHRLLCEDATINFHLFEGGAHEDCKGADEASKHCVKMVMCVVISVSSVENLTWMFPSSRNRFEIPLLLVSSSHHHHLPISHLESRMQHYTIDKDSTIHMCLSMSHPKKSILIINPNSTISMTNGLKPLVDTLGFTEVRPPSSPQYSGRKDN